MTSAVHKLQRLLGLRFPERFSSRIHLTERERPLVLISHMEHHSNQITWNACAADVVVVRPAEDGLPDLNHLEHVLRRHRRRALKIGSFTACSNVTGLLPPIHTLAEIMHRHGGYCFVDATAAAPYLRLNLHPGQNEQRLDALFFAAHKFLGGPGSAGVLLFARELYHLRVPDQGGGGTVAWTNPWGEQGYYDDIEMREDGGTPGFIPAIKAALAVLLKEKLGLEIIRSREEYLKDLLLDRLAAIPGVHIMEAQHRERLGIVSWHVPRQHHNLLARLLCDRFGIQVRGGCQFFPDLVYSKHGERKGSGHR
jgi:selenocysteine lyase/cysteine desulfurase